MTTQKQFKASLEQVALILLGRRTAIRTEGIRGDVAGVLDIAEELHKEDLRSLAFDDPEYRVKSRQATRKLDAIEQLKILSNAIAEFDW